jgi:hypothetical protein
MTRVMFALIIHIKIRIWTRALLPETVSARMDDLTADRGTQYYTCT